MDQKCLPSWRNPARYPTSPDADAFVHASHLMGGVHQRGGRRAAHRAAHRGAVGPERSGRSILKITSLCRCAGPQEAAFCVLRAMRHRGCYGIGGRVLEHRVQQFRHISRTYFLHAVSAAIDVRATVTHAHLCPPRHGVEQPALLRALLHRASERLHRTRLAEGGACTVKGGGWLGQAWSGPASSLGAPGCPEPPGAP